VACVIALVLLAIAGWCQSGRGLWQDEATLLANLGLPLSRYFASLPFYDQAAPPLALLTLDAGHWLAQGSPAAMRLLLLGLNLALFAAMAVLAYRRRDQAVLLAIAVIAVTPLAVRYCVELKQYGFETQASLLFLVALRWRPDRPGTVMLLAALLSFFSYSIMLVVGVTVLDTVVFRWRGPLARRWLALLAAYTVGWLACYVLLFHPSTALQTANYPDAYERLPLLAYLHKHRLLFRFQFIVWGQAYIALICGLIALLALHASRLARRATTPWWNLGALRDDLWQPLRVGIVLLALVLSLWLAKLYPVASDRQFMFLMPVGAMMIANLVTATGAATRRPLAIWAAVAVTLVPSAATVVWHEWDRTSDFQDTHGLYTFLKREPSALVLPDVLFEPTLRYYAAQDPQPPRRVAGWLLAETKPMETPREATITLARDQTAIHQHVWEALLLADRFSDYAGWLVRHARGRGTALIGVVQVNDAIERAYADAARRQGCAYSVPYRSRGVAALRLDCPVAAHRQGGAR
jgi:hypothetical protein